MNDLVDADLHASLYINLLIKTLVVAFTGKADVSGCREK
jgi:hypothetical protein